MRTKDIFIVVALCATFLGCSFHRVVSMPEDLIGVWKTAEKRYADRYFELREDRTVCGRNVCSSLSTSSGRT